MKNLVHKLIKPVATAFVLAMVLIACETNPDIEPQADILPTQFGVDIPNSLSNNGAISGRITGGRVTEDFLQGNDIYQHMETFILVGESAAEIVEDIIGSIRKHNISRAQILSFKSDDDDRVKNLVVVELPEYEGVIYEYGLTITDAESEGNQDGGYGLQIFWNRNPIKGVALIKPRNLDLVHDADAGEAIYKIEYNSESDLGYDAHMIVSIANLTLEEPNIDQYSMRTLKMFVGQKGDIVDVFGNSNHPNATFFTNEIGFNWAFVASASATDDLAVAEVGLPPSRLDETSRAVLLGTYAIKNVFANQIAQAFPNLSQDLIDLYLMNTAGPGYFTNEGFVAGGTPPSGLWNTLELRIIDLVPYNPKDITNLQINFQ